MLIFHGVVLILLWLGADAKCGNTWTRARSASDVVNFGVVAGLYDTGIQSYVGRTGANRIPARIQTDPLSFHYTFNTHNEMKHDGDYLKNNSDYDYIWVKANSKNCIDNAIMLDNTFFVGRTIVDGYYQLGNVMVGKVGIRYPSKNGAEVVSNEYEVLTCVEKCRSKGDLSKCESQVHNLQSDLKQIIHQKERLEGDVKDTKNDLESEKANSALLRQFLNDTEKKLKVCNKGCSDRQTCDIDLARCVQNINDLEKEVNNLKTQIKRIEEENEDLQAEAKALEKDFINEKNKHKMEVKTLQSSYVGVPGCKKSLQALTTTLNEEDKKELYDVIKSKLPADDLIN